MAFLSRLMGTPISIVLINTTAIWPASMSVEGTMLPIDFLCVSNGALGVSNLRVVLDLSLRRAL